MTSQTNGNSSRIYTNQTGINKNLLKLVTKYAEKDFEKPTAKHTSDAFLRLNEIVSESSMPIILDSGCGTGESSYALAEQYPDKLVVGIDKSAARLAKAKLAEDKNVLLLRADLVDMWRLMRAHDWRIDLHFLFYPNPWPKQQHLKRRWHGHPGFLSILQLSGELELRTNWEIYALEFVAATEQLLKLGLIKGEVSMALFESIKAISKFEQKYTASGHRLFQVKYRNDRTFD